MPSGRSSANARLALSMLIYVIKQRKRSPAGVSVCQRVPALRRAVIETRHIAIYRLDKLSKRDKLDKHAEYATGHVGNLIR
jgi:hypothetical protein